MTEAEPLTTYLELRESDEQGNEKAGLSHSSEGLVLFHVLELAAWGEPKGGFTFVHDAGDHGGRYVELARGLTRANWAVALPDLRGHGRSEGTRGHSNGLSEIVRDVQAVQDHLAYRLPSAPKVLGGVGLGAIWALAYALEKPGSLAGLVLVSPTWKPSFELPKPAGGLFKMFKKVGPDAPGFIGNEPARWTSDAKEQAALRADSAVHDVITLRAGEQAIETAARVGSRLGELSIPVIVLHGADDAVTPAAESQRLAGAKADVRVYPGGGHALFHGAAAKQAGDDLRDWIAKLG
ncbi:MAG: alpha/beta fold hydrolase [Planctomycetes bacterium]|nr:alpha/beta fold hydrolase [Planctomycetota bacterium]